MRVQFVGVGEAFDETLPNNSQLLEWNDTHMLVDCGYAVPFSLWTLHPDPDYVDAIYISHRHADHYFGLPSYLLRLAEERRKRPVEIFCPDGMEAVIREMIEYAYLGLLPKFGFETRFTEMNAGEAFSYRGAELNFAPSTHPVKNYSLSVSWKGRKYAYSGDGNFNDHTRRLYHRCTFLVHESYSLTHAAFPGHAVISEVIRMAEEQEVSVLALTHLQRDVRRSQRDEIVKLMNVSRIRVILPEPGEIHEVPER